MENLIYAIVLAFTLTIGNAAPLPAELSALIQQVETSKVDYPERAADIRSMSGYIENGNFDMAAFNAKNIIKQQGNLK